MKHEFHTNTSISKTDAHLLYTIVPGSVDIIGHFLWFSFVDI